ncbi:twin-arginine translocase TatA/TatE family subunit [Streptomyces sp. NPDC004520]
MFGISEMVILLIVVILLLGAKNLPELARSAGKGPASSRARRRR